MLRSFGFVSVLWSFFIQRAILWLILVLKGSIRSHASPSSPSPRQVPAQPQLPGVRRGERVTHTGAADEDHAEGLHDARDAHHPSEPQEEDDTKDVLQAR